MYLSYTSSSKSSRSVQSSGSISEYSSSLGVFDPLPCAALSASLILSKHISPASLFVKLVSSRLSSRALLKPFILSTIARSSISSRVICWTEVWLTTFPEIVRTQLHMSLPILRDIPSHLSRITFSSVLLSFFLSSHQKPS